MIDKQKLLKWLNRNIDANQLSQGGIALKILREQIEFGTFDEHSTQEEITKLKDERDEWQRIASIREDTINTLERILKQAEQERDELLRMVKQKQGALDAMFENREKWRHDHEQLTVDRNSLLEVLKFYADELNYYQPKPFATPFVEVDKGTHARSIIAKIEGKEISK